MCCNLSKLAAVAALGSVLAAFDGGPAAAANDEWDSDWTVAAMDFNGSTWGVGTATDVNQATRIAFARCKQMSKQGIGCGTRLKAVRAGWILALRCGSQAILETGENLKDAEDAAIARARELRQIYAPDVLACERLFLVNNHGVVENLKTPARVPVANQSE